MKGIIHRLIPLRGFGFIKGDDGHQYFLHVDDLSGKWESLMLGAQVEFTPTSGGKKGNGLRAEGVKVC